MHGYWERTPLSWDSGVWCGVGLLWWYPLTLLCSHLTLTRIVSSCSSCHRRLYLFAGLPDAASIEAAGFVEPDNDRTVIIDASTAYRVDEDWVYGFPGMTTKSWGHSTNNMKMFDYRF